MGTTKLESQIRRLQKAVEEHDAGKPLRRRDVYRLLGEKGRSDYDLAWKAEQSSRADKPAEIVEYTRRLKAAHFKFTISENQGQRRDSRAGRTEEKAEALFQRALEYLREAVTIKPDLRMWLDRGPNDPGVDCSWPQMPQPIWSASMGNQSSGTLKRTKKDIALEVVQAELATLKGPEPIQIAIPPKRKPFNTKDWKF